MSLVSRSLPADPALPIAKEQSLREAADDDRARFLADVIAGLGHSPKRIPCKYFYDAEGSRLFDQICELPEYYPTRTELAILRECLPEVRELVGAGAQVIEFGSGSGLKTRLLLSVLREPTGCVLVEISPDYLNESATALAAEFPTLQIDAICADYTQPLDLPDAPAGTRLKLAFFPGSTIGNFEPAEARQFLAELARAVGPGGGLFIGADLQKSAQVLEAAYDDASGVTAAFNRNLLARANRELGADFQPDDFEHRAVYDQDLGRIEMHLVARRPLALTVGGQTFAFGRGESIHTESSYKYTLEGFDALAEASGWRTVRHWIDRAGLFSVHYLVAR